MGPYATNAFVRSARASVNKRLEERESVDERRDGGEVEERASER